MAELAEILGGVDGVFYQDDRIAIVNADVLTVLREMPDGCVHTVVTSPPY